MEVSTLLGIVVAVVAVVYSILAGGGSLGALVDYPALACVGGGCTAALLIGFPWRSLVRIRRVFRVALWRSPPDTAEMVDTLIMLSELARRDGLLAVEAKLPEVKQPFVVLGMQMAVDGAPPEMIEDVLRSEMDSLAMRHRMGKSLFDQLGKHGPAFGMIGTLLGLVVMLSNMSDPAAIGPGMAVALLTTLYGALLANALFLPLAEKLSILSRHELWLMEAALKGILAIQAGDHPWIVERELNSYSPRRSAAAA